MSNTIADRDPLRSHDSRGASKPSLVLKTTTSSGPSKNEPAIICSTWTIGWQTPALMISCYVLGTSKFWLLTKASSNLASALALALIHLILFRVIDGREADGPFRIAPQSYIATASNIIANAFGVAIKASLAVAFSQYLWHLFRIQSMKVSTIELLFAIRSNPFQIFRAASLKATPILCALALLMWLSSIVISFPPGAITIATAPRTSYETVSVPSFNASFVSCHCNFQPMTA